MENTRLLSCLAIACLSHWSSSFQVGSDPIHLHCLGNCHSSRPSCIKSRLLPHSCVWPSTSAHFIMFSGTTRYHNLRGMKHSPQIGILIIGEWIIVFAILQLSLIVSRGEIPWLHVAHSWPINKFHIALPSRVPTSVHISRPALLIYTDSWF